MEKLTKITFITEDLSNRDSVTFLIRKIQELKKANQYDIHVIEWNHKPGQYQDHRQLVINELNGNHFWSLGTSDELPDTYIENRWNIRTVLQEIAPDIIHFEESPETFVDFPSDIQQWIYDNQRTWRIVESCQSSAFDANCAKQWEPDAYALVSLEQIDNQFAQMKAPKELIQFPVEALEISESMSRQEILGDFKMPDVEIKHIVNIGPLCPTKNQAYLVDIARAFHDRYPGKYQFHLVGSLDPEWEDYWSPLTTALPENVKIWGEQVDVWKWLRVADMMLHTSIQESDPITFREAFANGTRVMAYPLRSYRNMYNATFTRMTGVLETDIANLLERLTCKCARPKPVKGQDGERFLQQLNNLYSELIQLEPNRNAVEQTPNSCSIEWSGGPIVTNHGSTAIQIDWIRDGVQIQSSECYPGMDVSINSWMADWELNLKWPDGSTDQWSFDVEGKDVGILIESNVFRDTMAWIDVISQWSDAKKPGRVWIKTPWVSIINWEYYQRKSNMYPLYDEQVWYPDVDITHRLDKYSSEDARITRQIAGDQLGIQPEERRTFTNLRPVQRPNVGKYIIIAPDADEPVDNWKDVKGWQELIDWHVARDYTVFYAASDGIILNDLENVVAIPGGLLGIWNCLHWCEYFISSSTDMGWLAWSGGKQVVTIGEPKADFTALRFSNDVTSAEVIENLEKIFDK
jgi:hypothetical protein